MTDSPRAGDDGPRVSYLDTSGWGDHKAEWVPAAPLPLYLDPVPPWWKRLIVRAMWPVLFRGWEKPTWMD